MRTKAFCAGRDMLQKDASVLDALHMLVDKALTEEAKHYAEGALMALDPQEHEHEIDVDALHVMVSYQWADQVRCTFVLVFNLTDVASLNIVATVATVYCAAHRARPAGSWVPRVV